MYLRHITNLEAGQRLDRYLSKLLPMAGSGFLHKMLRKKKHHPERPKSRRV